jgi:hypothetical protein
MRYLVPSILFGEEMTKALGNMLNGNQLNSLAIFEKEVLPTLEDFANT